MRVLKRVSAMSAHEIATRARQAAGARVDALRCQLGLPPATPPIAPSVRLQPGKPPDSTTPSPFGNFFFDPADAQSIAAQWMQINPAAAAATIARAEQILTRRYPILGYSSVDFEDPVDWQRDPINHKRSSLVPFVNLPGDLPYLDFHNVGDSKVTWELSRHQHLLTLVRAYLFTGDRRFADEALLQFRHWRTANPYPLGINWTSTLEAAFRTLSWMWMDHMLAGSPLHTSLADRTELRQEFMQGISHGAHFCSRYLSTYFAPNTHLLGEAYAMFAAGTLYRMYKDAPRWAAEGWRIVNEEARNQVFADGFHFEQSTYYHTYALDFFLHARQLGARNGLDTSTLDEVIPRMANALATISQAGQTPRFGDDDGGRLFDPARNTTPCLTDPLATAGALYNRPDWMALAGAPLEETLWLMGPVPAAANLPGPPAAEPRSMHFPNAGYVCLAQPGALLIADAGPHGWGNGAHGHADALSIQLISRGEALLTDPGAGTYPFETPIRNQLRQTSAHSTLEIDGRGQARPQDSFKWTSKPVTTLEHFHLADQGGFLEASHDGYKALPDPVTHRRTIVSWNGGNGKNAWLVLDRAAGEVPHSYRLHWQLPPHALPTSADSGWTVRYPSGQVLHLVAGNAAWQWQQQPTLYSPAYGALEPAIDLVFTSSLCAGANVATLLALGGERPRFVCTEATPDCTAYRWQDGTDGAGATTRRIWFAERPGTWRCAGIESDASFVLIAADADGKLCAIWLAGARCLAVNGRAVLDSPVTTDWISWSPGQPGPAAGWEPASLAEFVAGW